jgi:hypothetical protein
MAWFKTTSPGGIMGYGGTCSAGSCQAYDRLLYVGTDNHLNFGVWPNGWIEDSNDTVDNGSWHFAVGTLSSSGEYLYLDGSQVAYSTNTTGWGGPGWWWLGEIPGGCWSNTATCGAGPIYFQGQIADVAVFDSTAVTASEVESLWKDRSMSGNYPPQQPVALPTSTSSAAAWCSSSGCTPIVENVGGTNYYGFLTGGWCAFQPSSGNWGDYTVSTAATGSPPEYFVDVKVAWGGAAAAAKRASDVTALGVNNAVVVAVPLPVPQDAVGSSSPAPGTTVGSCPIAALS